MLASDGERKKALSGKESETIYRALWASAFEDSQATIPLASKLLKHTNDEIRFVAVWLLTQLGLEAANKVKASAIDDANLQVAILAAAGLDGWSVSPDLAEDYEMDETSYASNDAFEQIERLYARLPEKATQTQSDGLALDGTQSGASDGDQLFARTTRR